jgi:D-alanyl-lipoteichoic acid acyltransferase DltB (MBOAT superfamily)
MLFNSTVFIFVFLPITLLGYWVLSATSWRRPRLWWLAAASMFFYGYWAPRYMLLLAGAMAVNYVVALLLQRAEPEQARKHLLWAGVGFNLALLFFFKYFNFFIDNVDAVTGAGIIIPHIVLPLAISFFTFQKIALLFDIYRRKITLGGVSEYITFVLFFPQLIAGPIVHYSELEPQLAQRPRLTAAGRSILIGLTIFSIGLFKKTVLADTAALYATPIFDAARDGAAPDFAGAWLAAAAYTLQIYFDFSGYSDMALGLARMFGVLMPLNFHSPLRSANMAEVWRRWHMTLSRFVQSYIFQPLSMPLARFAAARFRGQFAFLAVSTLLPTFLSMVIIGAWHGAAWNFFIFGAMHGVYVATYEAWNHFTRKRRKKKPQGPVSIAFAHLLTVLCFIAAVVPFRAAGVNVTGMFFSGMIGLHGLGTNWAVLVPLGAAGMLAMLAVGWLIVALLPNTQQFMTIIEPALEWKKWSVVGLPPIRLRWAPTIGWSVVIGLFLFFGIAFITRGTTEFIYFNF